ncbi:MAG: Wzz/FepE/Etk N-terminal domain-containing protein, partial [Streptococcus minor]|nr:Wzz/FepE/Etk N-terminal domain-containing protein [Streptococcus minor]
MNTSEQNSIEIDVLYLLRKLWQKKVIIVFSTVLFGLIALLISIFILKPTYT